MSIDLESPEPNGVDRQAGTEPITALSERWWGLGQHTLLFTAHRPEHKHARTNTRAHTPTHTHTHAHTYTHAHAHTHTHTPLREAWEILNW